MDYASEYRYRDPLTGPNDLTILITQSGETADTIAAMRESRAKGSKTLGVCNVVGSMIARESNGTIYTHAGPEIGVASTKAFTAQLTALFLFAVYLGEVRGTISSEEAKKLLTELTLIPGKLEALLSGDDATEELAKRYHRAHDFLYLGRGIHYPIALEGALKMKEISYIHAEGYPAGEMKHGPNALIDEESAGRDHRHARSQRSRFGAALREDDLEPQGSESAFRNGNRGCHRRRRGD